MNKINMLRDVINPAKLIESTKDNLSIRGYVLDLVQNGMTKLIEIFVNQKKQQSEFRTVVI